MKKAKRILALIIRFIKKKPIISAIGFIIFILVGFSIFSGQDPLAKYDIGTVERRDIESLVDVTGKVRSPSKVDLGLERGGKIARIEVAAGDSVYTGQTLIVTNNSDLWASLAEAKANLAVAQLDLEEIQETSVLDESSAFTDLANALQDVRTSTEDAIWNDLSEIFRGSTSNDQIGITGDLGNIITLDLSLDERLDIRYQKKRLDKVILTQRNLVNAVTRDSALDTADTLETTLLDAQSLLDVITEAFDTYDTDDLDDQAAVDAQRGNLFSARGTIGGAIVDLRSARQDYLKEVASLVSDNSSDYLRSVLLQQERVNAAQARVDAALAEISKSVIVAPFSGTITKVDTEVGEIVSANNPAISIISDEPFEVEAYIAEADIAKVSMGAPASATLDAYGSDQIFDLEVVYIDPAETVIDGVATYKVVLHFKVQDERVRSGMTANVSIILGKTENVLAVPQRAIIEKGGKSYVQVVGANDQLAEVEVTTGLRGVDGYIEVTSGLNEHDQVVVFVRG